MPLIQGPQEHNKPARRRQKPSRLDRSEHIDSPSSSSDGHVERISHIEVLYDPFDRPLSNLMTIVQGLIDLAPLIRSHWEELNESATQGVSQYQTQVDYSATIRPFVSRIFQNCRYDVVDGIASALLENWKTMDTLASEGKLRSHKLTIPMKTPEFRFNKGKEIIDAVHSKPSVTAESSRDGISRALNQQGKE